MNAKHKFAARAARHAVMSVLATCRAERLGHSAAARAYRLLSA